ncbi:hypothetical protein GGR38_001191 [Novosphingobium sediminicola]|uniref:Uncharacterized protein n=1 Tax=Novosphingobium sediminicola TaxID=563162 RepID=A0A7W6G527_9SPHN|nr:hypothetical protein [Novosphingobium sediminicola]
MAHNAGEDALRIKTIERIGVRMANAACHDLHQNLTGLGAFKINLDDFEPSFGRKNNGGSGLYLSASILQ